MSSVGQAFGWVVGAFLGVCFIIFMIIVFMVLLS